MSDTPISEDEAITSGQLTVPQSVVEQVTARLIAAPDSPIGIMARGLLGVKPNEDGSVTAHSEVPIMGGAPTEDSFGG